MIVACGFDHAGYPLRDRLLQEIRDLGHEVLDFGTDRPSPPIDYPDKALEVGHAVASGRAERGIIVCGSGAGVSVAAGKIRGVRRARSTTTTPRTRVSSTTASTCCAWAGA